MRVMIVDDEPRYRVYLSARLSEEGYEVAVAANGREAIDRGVQFRPDVLVTDWMLKNHLHGLHIASALGTVNPETRTILMTGFVSEDLRSQARSAHIQFMEKPFAPDDLVDAVERAPVVPAYLRPVIPFGVIAIAATGLIVHASPKAREMLSSLDAPAPQKIQDLFGHDALDQLEAWFEGFERVAPSSHKRLRWWIGARPTPEGTVLVLLPERKRFLRLDPRVALVLGRPLPSSLQHTDELRILVIDDAPIEDAAYVGRLEAIGCVCYKAESPDLAFQLLRAEPQIDLVVIDLDTATENLRSLVDELRGIRPGVILVAVSSTLAGQLDAAHGGVNRFLSKPWTVGDLMHVLTE